MSRTDLLLVGQRALSAEMSARVGQANVVACDDPYDALLELSRRPWPTVVLTAPRPDFAGLCRACRRLQPQGHLVALCSPGAEMDVRPLRGTLLDDYFVYPPSRQDWASLRLSGQAAPGEGDDGGGLSGAEFSVLASSARSVPALEEQLAAVVSRRLGWAVHWVQADQSAGVRRLLEMPGGQKVLVARAHGGEAELQPPQRAMLDTLQKSLGGLVESARRAESLHRLAVTDHLTGAYNRRYFFQLTDHILLRAQEKKFRVTLLLYDMDDFKRYNDTYGHEAGDEILRETARLMKRTTRRQDIVARIGGDEFAVLFWDSERPRQPNSRHPDTAYVLADRFRQAVLDHDFRSLGPEAKGSLTISGGLARFPVDGTTCQELLRQADNALHEAKGQGKNVIHLVGGSETGP